MYVSIVSSVFFSMLQLLHLDVSEVNRMLHMGIWDGCGKRLAARATSGVAQVRCWDTRSQAQCAMVLACSLNRYRPMLALRIERSDSSKFIKIYYTVSIIIILIVG
jgi:hypothetical protein